jgi:hypothetical protein
LNKKKCYKRGFSLLLIQKEKEVDDPIKEKVVNLIPNSRPKAKIIIKIKNDPILSIGCVRRLSKLKKNKLR